MIKDLITNKTKVLELSKKENNKFILSRKTHVKKDIVDIWDSWYVNDGKWYYFKEFRSYDCDFYQRSETRFINELIGEVLARKLDLDTITYLVAKVKDSYGLASESFINKSNKYYHQIDLYIPTGCTNLKNLERIRSRCKSDENHRELVDQIAKLSAIDIYMNQTDRNYSNVQFRKDSKGLHLAPCYDFEESYMHPENPIYESSLLRIDLASSQNNSPEHKLILDKLHSLFELDIDKILEGIEDNHKILIPSSEKDYYRDFTEKRKKLIK